MAEKRRKKKKKNGGEKWPRDERGTPWRAITPNEDSVIGASVGTPLVEKKKPVSECETNRTGVQIPFEKAQQELARVNKPRIIHQRVTRTYFIMFRLPEKRRVISFQNDEEHGRFRSGRTVEGWKRDGRRNDGSLSGGFVRLPMTREKEKARKPVGPNGPRTRSPRGLFEERRRPMTARNNIENQNPDL
ncbi:hypothetical protein K0M31_004993 [Melipona bicolor]|uniref:Uncharacterized protein n=1 Tax=Melipona bicolor TaxID=60889 RepID=A0AA40KMY0_9HYME|nr:hypothetical protein K0M31_004993 [Melipona bicolor]